MRHRRAARFQIVTLALIWTCGCGGSGVKDAVPTFPVKGTLTLDGAPFGPVQLRFKPDDPSRPIPGGQADASGNFSVKTYVDGDGAPAGAYKVYLLADPTMNIPSHPKVYDSPDTSPLMASVKESGNELKLEMKSSAGPATEGPANVVPAGVQLPPGFDPTKAYPPVRGPGAK